MAKDEEKKERIKFVKKVEEASFQSPVSNFDQVKHPIEYRTDPLTGKTSRLNVKRSDRTKQAMENSSSKFSEIVKKSEKDCFFCRDNLKDSTPKFSEEFTKRRITKGEAIVFPNLYPFAKHHGVGIFSDDHYISPDKFSPNLIRDCFVASIKYIRSIQENDQDTSWFTISWNFMPPAAASIIHPHVQILGDPYPTLSVREVVDKSKQYYNKNGENYWQDLIEKEMENDERWIGKTGSVNWITSFAPKGNNEVTAVVEGTTSLKTLSETKVQDLSFGLSKLLTGYQEIGVNSFNFTIFSAPPSFVSTDNYLLNARLMSRPSFERYYTNDSGFMEKFHEEPIVEGVPEKTAKCLRSF